MKEQTLVRHRESGKLGVICPTSIYLSDEGPWSVFYDGAECPITLLAEGGEEAFEVIGPENAVADPRKCGAGQGAQCCIFLVVGSKGFECERFGQLRYGIEFRSHAMNSKRKPRGLFPLCQLTIESDSKPAEASHA